MRIAAPVASVAEVEPVLTAGADEIYFGVVERTWSERFGDAPQNRRLFANLASVDEMRRVVDLARRRGARTALTLNAPHYTDPQVDALCVLAAAFAADGGDAVIVGDFGLLVALQALAIGRLELHASSILACRNAAMVAVLSDLVVRRVVLPRFLTLAEVASIVARSRPMAFESFVMNDACFYEEGHCRTNHLAPADGGPFCLEPMETNHVARDGRPLPTDLAAKVRELDRDCCAWKWAMSSRGFTSTPWGLPYSPCGLCAIPALDAAGVGWLKVAGRFGPTARKLASIEAVRAARDLWLDHRDGAELVRFCQGLRGVPDACRTGRMCFYPADVLLSRGGPRESGALSAEAFDAHTPHLAKRHAAWVLRLRRHDRSRTQRLRRKTDDSP